jgi:hypothetical protein
MSAAIYNQHVTNTAKVSNATHTGDVTDASGVLTVSKINGVALAPLGTGILRMSSGTPSLATDGTQFPTLNQNTTGTAATATTATNLASGSAGSVPYQTAANTTAMLSAGTAGQFLKSNGAAAPVWGAVNMSTDLTGTLPVDKGGTGAAILSGILKGNGTNAFTAVTQPAGDLVGTTATQTLTNKTLGSGTIISTSLTVASGGTGINSYTIGDILYANTATTLAKLPDVATGNVLISGGVGAAPSYGKVGLTTHVTGILPIANGGTGVTALASGFIKSNGTVLTSSAAPISIEDGGTGVTQSAYGECYISSITTTSIGTAGTFVKVGGTTTAGFLSNFTHSNSNRLTYTGTATRKFLITAALSFHGTGTNDYKFAFHKNTSSLLSPSIVSTTGSGTGDLAHVSIQTIVELATNDFIEVFVTNADATNSATIDFMNVTAVALI